MDTLGPVFPPVTALVCVVHAYTAQSGSHPFWAEAYQHLWLLTCDDGFNSSRVLAMLSEPSPLAA